MATSKRHSGFKWDAANARLAVKIEGVEVMAMDSTSTSAKWGVFGKCAAQQAVITDATTGATTALNAIIDYLQAYGMVATA